LSVSEQTPRAELPLDAPDRPRVAPLRQLRAVRRVLEEECFILLAISLTLTAVVVAAPASMVVPDTWLALVDGRLIAEHGLPHVDQLTAWTAGAHWVDQQWLGQLGFYELARAGGIKLCVAAALALDGLALAGAAVAARRLGASTSSVALGALIPIVVGPWLLQARTQSLALPLFVAVYALVAADAHRPSRRVYAAIPLLVLWANVHGSASLGAALLLLYGVLELVHRRPRGLILALAAPAALVCSPYGFDLVGYYHTMLISSPLGQYVLEWGPTHLDLGTAPFFALAFLSVFLLARHGQAVSLFERLALPLFVLLGLLAARNTIWLGLACAVSAPTLFDRALGPSLTLTRGMRRLNAILSASAVACAAVVIAVLLTRPVSVLLPNWPSAGAAALAAAAGPRAHVLADDAHSDWLLWEQPQLTGRLAYDVRFELFTSQQLGRLQAFRNGLAPGVASGYRVLTFTDIATARRLVPSARIVYRGSGFFVVAR
jgi:hypothetical protein